jgi:hypothetical protein
LKPEDRFYSQQSGPTTALDLTACETVGKIAKEANAPTSSTSFQQIHLFDTSTPAETILILNNILGESAP